VGREATKEKKVVTELMKLKKKTKDKKVYRKCWVQPAVSKSYLTHTLTHVSDPQLVPLAQYTVVLPVIALSRR
jgi:hypothetical protein